MQTEEHFLRYLEHRIDCSGQTVWCLFVHTQRYLSLWKLASVIPTRSLKRPSYLIYPLFFSLPKTGVSRGCHCSSLHALEPRWLSGAHSNSLS